MRSRGGTSRPASSATCTASRTGLGTTHAALNVTEAGARGSRGALAAASGEAVEEAAAEWGVDRPMKAARRGC